MFNYSTSNLGSFNLPCRDYAQVLIYASPRDFNRRGITLEERVMTGPHPSRFDGDVPAERVIVEVGQTFTVVNRDFWKVINTLDKAGMEDPSFQDCQVKAKPAFLEAGRAGLKGPPLGVFNRLAESWDRLTEILGLSQTHDLRVRDFINSWSCQFGVVTEVSTEVAFALWRDRLGMFHVLVEQDLHLGQRSIHDAWDLSTEALNEWDDCSEEAYTIRWALTTASDATKIQWTWEDLSRERDKVAQQAGVRNPIILVALWHSPNQKEKVFAIRDEAAFAELIAGWLRIVGKEEQNIREFCPVIGIVDGDKWRAPNFSFSPKNLPE
jgi:hypothetical protein